MLVDQAAPLVFLYVSTYLGVWTYLETLSSLMQKGISGSRMRSDLLLVSKSLDPAYRYPSGHLRIMIRVP